MTFIPGLIGRFMFRSVLFCAAGWTRPESQKDEPGTLNIRPSAFEKGCCSIMKIMSSCQRIGKVLQLLTPP